MTWVRCNINNRSNAEIKPFSDMTYDDFKILTDDYYDGDIELDEIKSVWAIGDSKQITIEACQPWMLEGFTYDTGYYYSEGPIIPRQQVTVRIIDFNKDTLSSGNKSIITMGIFNLNGALTEWADKAYYGCDHSTNWKTAFYGEINSNNTGGGLVSGINICKSISNYFPIKQTQKIKTTYDVKFSGIISQSTDTDYLWIPSVSEIKDSYYDFYKQNEYLLSGKNSLRDLLKNKEGYFGINTEVIWYDKRVINSEGDIETKESYTFQPHFCI